MEKVKIRVGYLNSPSTKSQPNFFNQGADERIRLTALTVAS